ncbi:MAG: hypothetical protein HY064_14605 [Bacteroidetes bacterium]|nr:hypothetical protein [Bacteroidota bacterium]
MLIRSSDPALKIEKSKMNNENDINLPADFDDLSKHAPLLHALQKKGDGFVVPENYFSDSAEIILAKTILPSADGFVIPENYFSSLAENIISLAALSELKDKESFSVPEGYFEKFADDVISSAELHAMINKDGFTVPENYFNEFDSELNTKIALDNLKQDDGFVMPGDYFEKLSSSVMSRISIDEKSEDETKVPDGYFDSLADRITARIREEENITKEKPAEQGRVIVFAEIVKRYSRPAAIAASVALVVAAAVWFLNRNDHPEKNPIAKNETHKNVNPVVTPLKKDSVPVLVIPDQHNNNMAQHDVKKQKPRNGVNHPHDALVKVEKKDIMDAIDLLDENTVADVVAEKKPDVKDQNNNEQLDQSMKDFLNDNSTLEDISNSINNH